MEEPRPDGTCDRGQVLSKIKTWEFRKKMERLLMKRNKNHKRVMHGGIWIKESCNKKEPTKKSLDHPRPQEEPGTRKFSEEGQGEPERTDLSQVVFPDQDTGRLDQFDALTGTGTLEQDLVAIHLFEEILEEGRSGAN